jgi:RHH-type transcriptional regulator, rel operon repressor / antitoxin RelB
MKSTTMTIRLDNQLKIKLENLAEAMHRTKSMLAVEAITEFVKLQEWQISESYFKSVTFYKANH